jgi:hypothetical protein
VGWENQWAYPQTLLKNLGKARGHPSCSRSSVVGIER